ncbi:hypothetical protein ACJ5H2_13350 [Nocardioides sp. R1-1]|uniref:hypothetical protein n=1 Tax=Nocardioides sp. R1-1 TaxID=3383502 RepID=UPI0038D0231E
MTGVKRPVRVVVEGMAHAVSDKCGILRIDLPADETGVPVVMVNPEWEGVTVEDVAPAYNWQDGDVLLFRDSLNDQHVWARSGGRWRRAGDRGQALTDGQAMSTILSSERGEVLRYQAGEA